MEPERTAGRGKRPAGHDRPDGHGLRGAILLFGLEPLAGRLLTPYFGGAAHVWLTCLMFFPGRSVHRVPLRSPLRKKTRRVASGHPCPSARQSAAPGPCPARIERPSRASALCPFPVRGFAFRRAVDDGRRGPGVVEPVPARQAPGALPALCRIQRRLTDRASRLHVRCRAPYGCEAAERGLEPDLCPLRRAGGGIVVPFAPVRIRPLGPADCQIRPPPPQRSAPQPTGSGSCSPACRRRSCWP